MAEATLAFNPGSAARAFDADSLVLEWKTNWADEWEPAPFTCEAIRWATCGDGKLSEATFRDWYGPGKAPGEAVRGNRARQDGVGRKFVRATLSDGLIERKWFGVMGDDTQDRIGTKFTTDESGTAGVSAGVQTFSAKGLEFLLAQTFVKTARIARNLDAVESVETKRGLTFNRDGIANCSNADDTDGGRFFHEAVDSLHWTTHQAVRYLLKRHAPLSFAGESKIPFSLYDAGSPILPAFDFPQLATHGRSVYDLLCTLIARQRGYGFYFAPNSDESSIELHPFTFVREDVELDPDDASRKLPANPSVYRLDIEADRGGSGAQLTPRSTEKFDRVIVFGARRRSCFTVNYSDDSLQNDWKAEDETAYNDGAKDASDYPDAAKPDERHARDHEARTDPKLRDVFGKFRFPEEWNLEVGDGEEGTTKAPILIRDAADEEDPVLYLAEARVQRTIPLLPGIDYSQNKVQQYIDDNGEAINQNDVGLPELAPFALLKLVKLVGPPEVARWLRLDTLGSRGHFAEALTDSINLQWSAEIEPAPDVPGFYLPIVGTDQHVIAKDRFAPENPPLIEPRFSYEDFLYTVAIEEDRRVMGMHEAEPTIGKDAVRELVIDAGEDFRLDYVAPYTVVGVNGVTGELLRSAGGYVRDDRKQLKETARLAFEFFRVGRVALAYQTTDMERMLQLPLGAYVRSIGRESVAAGNHNQDIESVVTEVSFRLGTATGTSPPPPSFGFRTDYAELDPSMRKGLA